MANMDQKEKWISRISGRKSRKNDKKADEYAISGRNLKRNVKNICIIQLKSVILRREKVLKSVNTYVVP